MEWILRLSSLRSRIRLGADPRTCPPGTIVLLPRGPVVLRCGIAALVEVVGAATVDPPARPDAAALAEQVTGSGLDSLPDPSSFTDPQRDGYLGGQGVLDALTGWARSWKRSCHFSSLATDGELRDRVVGIARRLREFATAERGRIEAAGDAIAEKDIERFSARVLRVQDVAWHVEHEAVGLVNDVQHLLGDSEVSSKLVVELRRVAAVLRSIDRIEIRGRDSAGLAVQVCFSGAKRYRAFLRLIEDRGLADEVRRRSSLPDLPALSIAASGDPAGDDGEVRPTVTFFYKVAAEVGRLGDNGAELRRQIRSDTILRLALGSPGSSAVLLGHTRWASSGVISIPNCHPVDNATYTSGDAEGPGGHRSGRIFVVMNGDVDNHISLREGYERATGRRVSPRVTTDTKVVALEIEAHIADGASVEDAFRMACARFEGSCAIGMVTDLAPGRLFLSLRGSGQSLYVGVSDDGFFASSEVYGVVEETARYVKMDGESERMPGNAATRGEIVLVGDDSAAGPEGVDRRGFDGSVLPLAAKDVRQAEITTRDVDRGDFAHFFRKEITQASQSVARTLWGRVSKLPDGRRTVSRRILNAAVSEAMESGRIRHVFVVGQGTAAVAGAGIAEYLRRVLEKAGIRVEATPASEMSGFRLRDEMTDTLVIAVTQSGSTADTNRAVDLARRRGALVVAVVNRRNSDITYRADCVVYTSDGRDVEMSVASTKAFYSQIVAGALLSLALAQAAGAQDDAQIEEELKELLALPAHMQKVLDDEDEVRRAAEQFAPTREHWAVVGSGPNQVAGREVRIKLSELCYKSISCDTVEDKKHIDLSAEPLVFVLAAGNPESVLNDVIKDVAIFKAHKALPIVFTTEGETRFDPYAAAVVHLPKAPPLTSMVLCALAGHLFGYHAARAIDDNARFLAGVRGQLVDAIEDPRCRENLFATLLPARRDYLERLAMDRFTSALHPVTAVRISTLFDLATGISVETPEHAPLLAGADGDVVAAFVNTLGAALDQTARPIDAIKHQAKIVTVGTSRPEEALTGVLGEALEKAGVSTEALAPVDQLALRRIQPAVSAVEGCTRYEVSGLRPDGKPDAETRVRVTGRTGIAVGMRSRVDNGGPLQGTKRQVVRDRRLFLGVGQGDGRRIAILPLLGSDRHVSGLVLFHLCFVDRLDREEKARVLGQRLDRVRDLVTEADVPWDTTLLDRLTPEQVAFEYPDELAERLLAD